MDKKIFELNFRGRILKVEAGELAKQANGAVLVRYEDTAVLTATIMNKELSSADFFPLTVIYNERLYSVGKIPGGFIKREGRPTDNATLIARLIDRPIRPLFPEDFRNEVQVVNTVLSVDQDNAPEVVALFGSSLALGISDIPFTTPIAGVKVGRVDGKLIINPTPSEMEKSDIDLTVAGTKKAINMVEAGSKEVSEQDMIDAIMFGHEAIKELITFQEKIIKEIGKTKIDYEAITVNPVIKKKVKELAEQKIIDAIRIEEKQARAYATDNAKQEAITALEEEYKDDEELENILKQVALVLEEIEYDEVRRLITEEKVRPDGRKINEIRPLNSQVDILARTHGSALFTRGQTQALLIFDVLLLHPM
jgi:polyribonucleotide nucleotidyltransferase